MQDILDYEVDYQGNIISILPKPRISYPPIPTQPPESLPLEDLDSDLAGLDFCICDYCVGNDKPGCVIQAFAKTTGGKLPKNYCKMFYRFEINDDGQEITYYMSE